MDKVGQIWKGEVMDALNEYRRILDIFLGASEVAVKWG